MCVNWVIGVWVVGSLAIGVVRVREVARGWLFRFFCLLVWAIGLAWALAGGWGGLCWMLLAASCRSLVTGLAIGLLANGRKEEGQGYNAQDYLATRQLFIKHDGHHNNTQPTGYTQRESMNKQARNQNGLGDNWDHKSLVDDRSLDAI